MNHLEEKLSSEASLLFSSCAGTLRQQRTGCLHQIRRSEKLQCICKRRKRAT